jgi:hypothetical protein
MSGSPLTEAKKAIEALLSDSTEDKGAKKRGISIFHFYQRIQFITFDDKIALNVALTPGK